MKLLDPMEDDRDLLWAVGWFFLACASGAACVGLWTAAGWVFR